MSAEWDDIEPVPTNWFRPAIQYEGEGDASFGDAEGTLRGHTAISLDERGDATAQMIGPVVVSGGKARDTDVTQFLLSDPPCQRLTVTSKEGTFDTDGPVFYEWEDKEVLRSADEGNPVTITFRWSRSQFAATDAEEERYWVLPLLNLLFSPNQHAVELDRHPLRIYPTPVVPHDENADRAFFRKAYAHKKNRLIVFQCFGELGFIEHLADYDERKAALQSGRERRLTTAVMVGHVDGASETWDAVREWFPFDVLGLLGLASGAEVGAPWLELRSRSGELVRRWHVTLGTPDYRRGHTAIDETLQTGTGHLLTCALASREFGSTHLRVAMRHLVDGLGYYQPIEERLGHFCRGIDGLCREYGFTGDNLLDSVGGTYRNAVRKVIAGAAKTIQSIADEAAAAGDAAEAGILETIAERTRSNPAYVDYNFGNAANRLMQHFGLSDPAVMARLFGNEGDDAGEGLHKWTKWLSECRGTPMHGGYFDVVGGGDDHKLLWQTTQHLLDVLLRIILRMVEYEGTYQPAVGRYLDAQRADWVTPETSPKALGYQ